MPIPDAVLAIGHPAGVHWLPIDAIQAFPSGESMRVHYVVCVLSCESDHCGVYFAGSGQHVSPTRCCCHKMVCTTMAHEVFWIGNLTSTSKKKVIQLRMRSLLKHSELTRNPISSRQSAVRVSWGQKNQKELRDSADSQRLLTSSMRWEWIAPFSDLRWCSAKSNTVFVVFLDSKENLSLHDITIYYMPDCRAKLPRIQFVNLRGLIWAI